MGDTQIKLAALWIVLVFIYIYGDIFRIMSGDVKAGKIKMGGKKITGGMWLGMSALMLIPILMIFLSLVLPHSINRWTNIVLAIFWFLFNLVGIPTYPSAYDRFLLIVSLGVNILTFWYAWGWV